MLKKSHFQTPTDLLQTLESRMRDRMARLGRFVVQHLTAVRDYAKWLRPVGRSLHHGFQTRGGIETAHSFCYKPRALTPEQRAGGDEWDSFCAVKAYMRDVHLNQEPLVVLTPAEAGRVERYCPQDVVPLRPFSKDRIVSLMALRAALLKPQFELLQAADAIFDLIHSDEYSLMRKKWLAEPRRVEVLDEEAVQGSAVFPHLPRTTWALQSQRGYAMPKREEHVPDEGRHDRHG